MISDSSLMNIYHGCSIKQEILLTVISFIFGETREFLCVLCGFFGCSMDLNCPSGHADVAGDDDSLHLGRAFPDLQEFMIAVETFDLIFLHQSIPPM